MCGSLSQFGDRETKCQRLRIQIQLAGLGGTWPSDSADLFYLISQLSCDINALTALLSDMTELLNWNEIDHDSVGIVEASWFQSTLLQFSLVTELQRDTIVQLVGL